MIRAIPSAPTSWLQANWRVSAPKVVSIGLVCLIATTMLSACQNGPEPTATSMPEPTAMATSIGRPAVTPRRTPNSTATPAPTPQAKAAPTPLPTPGLLSALGILDSATAALAALKSGHAEIEITVKVEAGGAEQNVGMGIVGDFQTPDRYQATMAMSVNGLNTESESEMVVIGGETYRKNPGSGAWEVGAEELTPYGDLFSFGAFDTDLDGVVAQDFEPVGQEELAGESVYYLKGRVSGKALADLLADPDATDGEGTVEYWVGVEDFLVRKTVMQVELSDWTGQGL